MRQIRRRLQGNRLPPVRPHCLALAEVLRPVAHLKMKPGVAVAQRLRGVARLLRAASLARRLQRLGQKQMEPGVARHLGNHAADFPNRLFRLAPLQQSPAIAPVQIDRAERVFFFAGRRWRLAPPVHLRERCLQGLVALAILSGEPGQ